MTTLAANLSATATSMRVNAAVANPAPYYQIDSEVVQLLVNGTTVQAPALSPNRNLDATLWQIERGISGTTAASHLSGATLTAVYDPSVSVGGAGVTVDNTVDPPSEVTTLIVSGSTTAGDEATFTVPTLAEVLQSDNDANQQGIVDVGALSGVPDITGVHNIIAWDLGTTLNILGDDPDDPGPGGTVEIRAGDANGAFSGGSLLLRGGGTGVEFASGITFHGADPGFGGGISISAPYFLQIVGLPTSDPNTVDMLWNDNGTLKISAG